MKNIVAVLFVLASTFLQAQAFYIDQEPDTVSGGIFPTATENIAYRVAQNLPDTSKFTMVQRESCLELELWDPAGGWKVLKFDPDAHRTSACFKKFSGACLEGKVNKQELLGLLIE